MEHTKQLLAPMQPTVFVQHAEHLNVALKRFKQHHALQLPTKFAWIVINAGLKHMRPLHVTLVRIGYALNVKSAILKLMKQVHVPTRQIGSATIVDHSVHLTHMSQSHAPADQIAYAAIVLSVKGTNMKQVHAQEIPIVFVYQSCVAQSKSYTPE